MAKQKQKATRNAPGTEFTFEVLILQSIFEIGALDDRFEIAARTPPTVIGEVDPALVPLLLATSGSPQMAVEGSEVDLKGFEEPVDGDTNVAHFQVKGRATWTDIPSWNSENLVGDIPVDQAKDLTPFKVWGKPTYGVDPDAECTSRPAFGLLYPRRAT